MASLGTLEIALREGFIHPVPALLALSSILFLIIRAAEYSLSGGLDHVSISSCGFQLHAVEPTSPLFHIQLH